MTPSRHDAPRPASRRWLVRAATLLGLLACEPAPTPEPSSTATELSRVSALRTPEPTSSKPTPVPASEPENSSAKHTAYPGLAPIEETLLAHTVRPGEDQFEIAGRYDEAPRWLRKWNHLGEDDRLYPGRKLSVRASRRPATRELRSYTVKAGDTVANVARTHGIRERSLARLVHKKTRASLEVGEELELWVEPTLMRWMASPEAASMSSLDILGAYGVGAPDDGYLANAVQLPSHPDWELRFPHHSYGDSWAVEATINALLHFSKTAGYEGELRIWSMSRRYGGEITAHNSHRTGRDLDIKLPLRAGLAGTLPARHEWIDALATWHLICAFSDTGRVQKIFLDHEVQELVETAARELGVSEARRRELVSAPRPRLSKAGLVRHIDDHEDHLHIRFTCPPWGVFCTDR